MSLRRLFARLGTARQARAPHSRAARLHLEALGPRILPSVTADLSNGTLDIVADDAANQVQLVRPVPDQVSVLDSGTVVATFASSEVQLAVFQDGNGPSTVDNATDIPLQRLRLFTSAPLTPDQLQHTGDLNAFLLGHTLSVAGPSGAGFQISGAWTADTQDTGDGQFLHTFTGSGPLVLRTAFGDVPFTTPDDQPLTITTAPNAVQADFGEVAGVSWTASLIDTVSAGGALRRLTDKFGIQVTTGVVPLNIQLGSDLAGTGLPVNPGLPYITVQTGDYNARFGQRTAAAGDDDPATVILDPADPALYVQTNEFTIAGSLKGQIPHHPDQDLPGLANSPIYGHLYGPGDFSLGDLPANFHAAATINLDARQDGVLLRGLTGNVVVSLFTNQTALATRALLAPNDLRVGLNGSGQIQYTLGHFTLSLPERLSAAYVPGHIALHGNAAGNPFAGTPLRFLGITQTVDVAADVDIGGAFDLTASTNIGTVAGVSVASWGVELNNSAITLDAHISAALGFGDIQVHGTVGSDGQFTLSTSVQRTIAGFVLAAGTVTLNNDGLVLAGQITVPTIAQVQVAGFVDNQGLFALTGYAAVTLAGFSAHAEFTLNNTRLTVSADLTVPQAGEILVAATVDTSGNHTLIGSATFHVNGFTLTATGTLTNTTLWIAASLTIPGGGQAGFTGSVSSTGQWSLTGHATLTVGGFTLVDAGLSFSNTQLTVAIGLTIPSVGAVSLHGTADAAGQFNLSATISLTVANFTLSNAALNLTNTSPTASGLVTVPGGEQVRFSGLFGQRRPVHPSGQRQPHGVRLPGGGGHDHQRRGGGGQRRHVRHERPRQPQRPVRPHLHGRLPAHEGRGPRHPDVNQRRHAGAVRPRLPRDERTRAGGRLDQLHRHLHAPGRLPHRHRRL
jgi:hypothetical protein